MMFVNRAGEVVFAKAYDSAAGARRCPRKSFRASGPTTAPAARGRGTGAERAVPGFALAAALSSHPILTSTLQGPGRGTLIMGRRLDTEEIAEAGGTTGLSLEFRRLDGELPEDYRAALPALRAGADGDTELDPPASPPTGWSAIIMGRLSWSCGSIRLGRPTGKGSRRSAT